MYMREIRFFGILFLLILCIFIFTRKVVETFTDDQQASIIESIAHIRRKVDDIDATVNQNS